MRHILRSSSNTATAPGGTQDTRLPPSGRPSLANKASTAPPPPPPPGDPTSPPPEQNAFSGLISRAKEGLSSSSSRTFHKTESQEQPPPAPRVPEKSETQIQWEEVEKNMSRTLKVILYSVLCSSSSKVVVVVK